MAVSKTLERADPLRTPTWVSLIEGQVLHSSADCWIPKQANTTSRLDPVSEIFCLPKIYYEKVHHVKTNGFIDLVCLICRTKFSSPPVVFKSAVTTPRTGK